ncbi:glycine--tRNA ligase [Candidatus Woesearchaeota archaeon]|nr:glycine--tRNA ligase [Candidatus Woesearchaeota archaeon]
MSLTIEEMAVFCKKKGFVYPNSEIYGGLSGFFDYGPLGVELKNNLKQAWWNYHVKRRDDIVGIDGSILANPKVWVASGHISNFTDILIECKKCHSRERADTVVEEKTKLSADGLNVKQLQELILKHHLKCPKCNSDFSEPSQFNLMFQTHVGPKQNEESIAYLRPETAQLIFANFKNILDTSRVKLPFGIAQIGKAFRNEIAPRNFLFRCREFEQMEIEYFVHPNHLQDCPYLRDIQNVEILTYSAEMQEKDLEPQKFKMKELLEKKIIKLSWHAYWLATEYNFFMQLGINPHNIRIRQHKKSELAHYASDCWDLEYKFPFGWKELQGIADRSDFDLKQHIKHSGKDLSIYDEEKKQKIIPLVIAEPSLGLDRSFLLLMYEAYYDDKERGNIVLKLPRQLTPYYCALFPLVKNKPELVAFAEEVYKDIKTSYSCYYDESGSVGRRYARADEIGVKYCITIDFDSLDDKQVTIRDRDTTKQERIPISKLKEQLYHLYQK